MAFMVNGSFPKHATTYQIIQEAAGASVGQYFLNYYTHCPGGCSVCEQACREPIHDMKRIDEVYVDTVAAALGLKEVNPNDHYVGRRVKRLFR